MGKFSKLFKGELKKIFLGVGIFLMALFLIFTLTIAPKFFNPIEQSNISNLTSISSTDVKQSYTSFIEEKSNYSALTSNIEEAYQDLINSSTNFQQNLVDISTNIFNLRKQLNNYIATGTNNQKSQCLSSLINELNEYKLTYNSYLNDHYMPLILVTSELDFDINFDMETLDKILNKSGDKNTNNFYVEINDALENYGSAYNLMINSNKIKNLAHSSVSLNKTILNFKDKFATFKTETLNNIEDIYNEALLDNNYNNSPTNTLKITNEEYNYLSVDYNYIKILENNLILEISNYYSDAELSTFLNFENFNSYEAKENYSKFVYLYNNNLKDSDFSNIFSFNSSSSSTSKTFDYMYFALELSSFLIILFTVILGSNIVSKEYSEGTIKLLLIRPFKRNKIILAKVLATLFFGFIFVLITTIVSLITGCILFNGITLTESVLLVINGSLTFVVPIWVEFLIYLCTLLIKIWIYSLLAIAISVLFKSNILSVCLSAGIYIVNLIVTFVSQGASWLKYNLFSHLDLFKYFGGSFQLNSLTNKNLNGLLTSSVFSGTSIWFSIIVITALAFVLNIIIFTVFKNRDLN